MLRFTRPSPPRSSVGHRVKQPGVVSAAWNDLRVRVPGVRFSAQVGFRAQQNPFRKSRRPECEKPSKILKDVFGIYIYIYVDGRNRANQLIVRISHVP